MINKKFKRNLLSLAILFIFKNAYAQSPAYTVDDCQQINPSGPLQCTKPIAHGWRDSNNVTHSTYQDALNATLAIMIAAGSTPSGSTINYNSSLGQYWTFANESDGNQQNRLVWAISPTGQISTVGSPINYVGYCAEKNTNYGLKSYSADPNTAQQSGALLENGYCIPQVQTETSCPDGKSCYGNVDVSSGSATDLQMDYTDDSNTPLDFGRYYSNHTKQWNHNYKRTVSQGTNKAGQQYTAITGPTGKTNTYYYDATQQAWIPQYGSTVEQLQEQKDSSGNHTGWLYTQRDNSIEQFDVNNNLIAIRKPQGGHINLTYDNLNRLSTITNEQGKSLTLAYQNNTIPANLSNITDYNGYLNALSTVTTPNGQTYQYNYDSNYNLSSVTDPNNVTKSFSYNTTTGDFSILNPDGTTYKNYLYDSNNKVQSVSLGSSITTGYSYTSGQTTATNSIGNTTNYSTSNTAGFSQITGANQTCPTCSGINSSALTYDASGNITSSTDFNGNITHYTYNSRNLETSRTEAFGTSLQRTITTDWNPNYRLPSKITIPVEGGNRIINFTYDSNANLTQKSITAPKNDGSGLTETRTWNYTYDSNGKMLTKVDPRNNQTTYVYDTNGNLNTITNPLNQTITLTNYNSFNKPQTITDPNGYITTLSYDNLGNTTQVNFAGEITQYSYDGNNQVTKMTRPDGSSLQYVYNAARMLTNIKMYDETNTYIGQAVFTIDAAGNTTKVEYQDDSNNPTHTKGYAYNSLSQIAQQIGAKNQKTNLNYDSQGNLSTMIDPLNHETDNKYDPLLRMNQIINDNGNPLNLGYDIGDNLKTVTDTNNHITTYTYNGFGNVIKEQSPDRGTINYTYDLAGNVLSKTDAKNITTNYTYDNINRVLTKNVNNSEQVTTFTYDSCTKGIGFVCSIADSLGGTINYTYLRNRIASKNYTLGTFTKTVSYGYNANGQLISMTYPSGKVVQLTYSNNQIQTMTINHDTITTPLITKIGYDPFDGVTAWVWGNGTKYVRNYDTDRFIQSIQDTQVTTFSKQFPTDNIGQVQSVFDVTTNLTERGYGYDNLNQLNLYNVATPSSGLNYTYDDVGNRKTSTITPHTGTPYTINYNYGNNNNQLTSLSGAGTGSFTYDNNGNMLTSSGLTMAYNGNNKMSSISSTTTGVTNYIYNGLGQRAQKSNSTTSNYYMYDENGHLIGEYDNNGNAIEETVYLYDIPVGVLVSPQVYYVHTDYLSTPRLITNIFGTTKWSWSYADPHGNSSPISTGITYNLRFPGQYADQESGLFYNMNRYYNPTIGRYTQVDPIGLNGGINPYAYVDNNPINAIDSSGLSSNDVFLLRKTFNDTVNNMTSNSLFSGLRTDWTNINNALPGHLNCIEQTNYMIDKLRNLGRGFTNQLEDVWAFKALDGQWHSWGVAVSSNPADPIIYFDTRAGLFTENIPCETCHGFHGLDYDKKMQSSNGGKPYQKDLYFGIKGIGGLDFSIYIDVTPPKPIIPINK